MNFPIQNLLITVYQQTMQYSKIQQITLNRNSQEQTTSELVVGICDYIPCCLKFNNKLTISIQGESKAVLNNIIWSQFFSKTLLKECQHHLLMQSYTSEGVIGSHPLFVKSMGKIYKLEDSLDWGSGLRVELLKSKQTKGQIDIQGFNQTGKIKQITIFFGQTPSMKSDIIFKMLPTADKAQQICRQTMECKVPSYSNNPSNWSSKVHSISSHQDLELKGRDRQNQQGDKKNRPLITNQSNCTNSDRASIKFDALSSKTNKTKMSLKRQEVLSNKQNKQDLVSKTSHKPASKSKRSVTSNLRKQAPTATTINVMGQTNTNIPETYRQSIGPHSSKGREAVMSKIISSKDEAIISLKDQLKNQEVYYEELLKYEKEERKEEENNVTNNIRKVLEEYEAVQEQQLAENNYLKERVRVLEEAVGRNESRQDEFVMERESLIKAKQHLEDSVQKDNELYKAFRESSQAKIQKLRQENNSKGEALRKWMQKSMSVQKKYDQLVGVMRNSLPQEI